MRSGSGANPQDANRCQVRSPIPARLAAADAPPRFTFSGIAVYRPEFFAGRQPGRFPLPPLLREAAAAGRVRGRVYRGLWSDIGTPERLHELDERLAGGANG